MNSIYMYALVAAVCLMPMTVLAQTQTQTQTPAPIDVPMAPQSTRDPPPGFPYNTGDIRGGGGGSVTQAQVPLRDFLSSRQDLQHAELTKRIDELQSRMQQLMDERDRQYAQRFAAQQEASEAALAASEDALEAALEAAERATAKAEAAANDRFESVNEFRATLADQANNFVNKSTADARYESLNEKVDDMFIRLNTIQAQREGGIETWGWVFGFVGLALAVFAFIYNSITKEPRVVVRGRADLISEE